jgi:hypothetical protein
MPADIKAASIRLGIRGDWGLLIASLSKVVRFSLFDHQERAETRSRIGCGMSLGAPSRTAPAERKAWRSASSSAGLSPLPTNSTRVMAPEAFTQTFTLRW